MQAHDNHPGVKKYREARRQATVRAMAEARVELKVGEILAINPGMKTNIARNIARRAVELEGVS